MDDYWTKFWRRQLSRRRLMARAGLIGTGIGVSLLVGCGEEGKGGTPTGEATTPAGGLPSPTPTPGRVQPSPADIRGLTKETALEQYGGKTLKYLPGWAQGPKYGGTINEATALGTAADWDITGPTGASLASFRWAHNQLTQVQVHELMDDPNFPTIAGELAESFEMPDDNTYVFHLRQGVRFHNIPPVNGRELTADDVVYSIETFKQAQGAQALTYSVVDKIEALDKYTVRMTLSVPGAWFLPTASNNTNWIFAREQHEAGELAKTPIGTGPFILKDFKPGTRVAWEKNPDYFLDDAFTGKRLPYLDGAEFNYVADPSARTAAFLGGQIDQVYVISGKRSHLADLVEGRSGATVLVWHPWMTYNPFINMRLDKDPWKDPRVRRALSLTVDRDAMIESIAEGLADYGYGLTYLWFGREEAWQPDELGQWMRFDPAEAKKLWEAAGLGEGIGRTVEILTDWPAGGFYDVDTLVADSWKRHLGLDVRVTVVDSATYYGKLYSKTYDDMAGNGFGIGYDDVEPDEYVFSASHSKSPANYSFVADPELDRLAEKQRTEMDKEERESTIKQWMARDLDLVPRIFTISQCYLAVRSGDVYNVGVPTPAGANPWGWGSHIGHQAWRA